MLWNEIGKFLIGAGIVSIFLGIILMLGGNLPLGKLPGDFSFGNENFKVYIPVATSILISIILTLIINFISWK